MMGILERIERAVARVTWRLYDEAVAEYGERKADEMVGPNSRWLMDRYPDERGR